MTYLDFFTEPGNWRGPDGIPTRVLEHLQLSGLAIGLSVLLALPLALTLGHLGRGGFLAVNTSNVGRALPSLALLGVFAEVLPRGYDSIWPSVAALVALAVPPLITNTYVGVREVDRDVVEAARGMGLAGRQVLLGVELPLALPLILAGLRTSTTNVVATAPLAALFAQGGLGRYIVDGQAQGDDSKMVAGALLVALLALALDALVAWLGRRARRRDRGPRRAATPEPAVVEAGVPVAATR